MKNTLKVIGIIAGMVLVIAIGAWSYSSIKQSTKLKTELADKQAAIQSLQNDWLKLVGQPFLLTQTKIKTQWKTAPSPECQEECKKAVLTRVASDTKGLVIVTDTDFYNAPPSVEFTDKFKDLAVAPVEKCQDDLTECYKKINPKPKFGLLEIEAKGGMGIPTYQLGFSADYMMGSDHLRVGPYILVAGGLNQTGSLSGMAGAGIAIRYIK